MFVKTDKDTQEEVAISNSEMTKVLKRDITSNLVDDTISDMTMGAYIHRDQVPSYKHKP